MVAAKGLERSVRTTHISEDSGATSKTEAVHHLIATVRDEVRLFGHVFLHLNNNGTVRVRIDLDNVPGEAITVNRKEIRTGNKGDDRYVPVELNKPAEITWVDKDGTSNILRIELQKRSAQRAQTVMERYGKDVNRIDQEAEAKEALLKVIRSGKMTLPLATSEEGFSVNISESEAAKARDFVQQGFHSWYTGNYNQETGKLALYRFLDRYQGFDRIVDGEADIRPRGLNNKTEDELLKALQKGKEPLESKFYELFRDYLDGKDVWSQIVRLSSHTASGMELDPMIYWTTKEDWASWPARYRVKIELEPNSAFRSGGIDHKGDWTGGVLHTESEWCTVGTVPKESIAEILDTQTGRVVYRKGQNDV